MLEKSIILPSLVKEILDRFSQYGLKAYLVGGCVRDSLLGKMPKDWDICTEALPQQIKEIFVDCPIVETGLIHGTVTVVFSGQSFEITTFRTEKEYCNHRKPSTVVFCKSVEQDLARRDFTINAMAYHPQEGVIDPYKGQMDLKNKILRCVGVPCQRLSEDALRILRALRFACCMGFTIEPTTKQAIFDCQKYLKDISSERIYTELSRMICGKWIVRVFSEYDHLLFQVIPQLENTKNFDQHSPYHIWDIWKHTLYAIEACPPISIIRLALLFHDIGKPYCFQIKNRIGRFYKHANKSAEITQQVLSELKLPKQEKDQICLLVQYHDSPIFSTKPSVKYWFNKIGVENFFLLLQVKQADILAKAPSCKQHLQEIDEIQKIAKTILKNKECFSIKQLKITGKDLINLGIPQGKKIGTILSDLLQDVIEEKLPNELDSLQFAALQYYQKSNC